jgi:hypothetical protein
MDVVTTGRAGLRLSGLHSDSEIRLNDIPVAGPLVADVIDLGLPMAGRWRVTGLTLAVVTS